MFKYYVTNSLKLLILKAVNVQVQKCAVQCVTRTVSTALPGRVSSAEQAVWEPGTGAAGCPGLSGGRGLATDLSV